MRTVRNVGAGRPIFRARVFIRPAFSIVFSRSVAGLFVDILLSTIDYNRGAFESKNAKVSRFEPFAAGPPPEPKEMFVGRESRLFCTA